MIRSILFTKLSPKKYLTYLAALFLTLSCNVYEPLSSKSSTEDYLDAIRGCLNDGDTDCALENAQNIPDTDIRAREICQVRWIRAGFSLNDALNVVTESGTSMLGDLANSLVPWTSAKGDEATLAQAQCEAYKNTAGSGQQGALLFAIGNFVDCAMRMAKTDQLVASSNSDTSCTTEGNNDGSITRSDISVAGSGDLSSGNGMCPSDVTKCRDLISSIDSGTLSNQGLTDINSALSGIPSNLKDSSAATITVRSEIRTTAQSD